LFHDKVNRESEFRIKKKLGLGKKGRNFEDFSSEKKKGLKKSKHRRRGIRKEKRVSHLKVARLKGKRNPQLHFGRVGRTGDN